MATTRLIAIELNDAAVVVADDSGVLHSEPAYVVVADGPARFGTDALPVLRLLPRLTNVRYWRDLSAEPLPRPLRAFRSNAEILSSHLRRLWLRYGSGINGVLYATPPWWSEEQLGVLADVSQEIGIPVLGLADAAVAATRNEYPGRELLELDVTLHGLAVTQIRQAGQASLGEREHFPQLGVEPLLRVATEVIARRFVECSRFDPLHDCATEQGLFAKLPDWLARLGRDVDAELELKTGSGSFKATVNSVEFKARIAAACEPLLQRLRARVATRGPHVLQLHHRFADFPGVLEALLRLPETVVHVLEPGAAARGVLSRLPVFAAAGARLELVTALPWDRPPAEAPVGSSRREALPHRAPSHLLLGHRAFRLGTQAFRIGAELAEDESGIALDPALRGVSRHHCTVRTENGALMVFDHSRYGTSLNGHRIEGAAVLEAGDVITLGTPPVELRLIAEVDERGA